MSVFDSIQNVIFGKKKSTKDLVENDALGKVIPEGGSIQSQLSTSDSGVVTEAVSSGQALDIAGLGKTIELQKEKIHELEEQVKGTRKHFDDYEKAKRNFEDQEEQLVKQEKEYSKYLSYRGILPLQKQEIQKALNQIRSGLRDIRDAKKQNEDFINRVKKMVNELDRAIKVNSRAVEENERALELAKKSSDSVQFQAKGIEEIERQVASEIPAKEILAPAVDLANSPPKPVQQIANSDDEYWMKGKIGNK